MPSGPIASGPPHTTRSYPVAWLSISLFLLAVAIDRHGSVRQEIGPRCRESRILAQPSMEENVREMLSHD